MITLKDKLQQSLKNQLLGCEFIREELTLLVKASEIVAVCKKLRDAFQFTQLIDLCGVDYSAYGDSGWETKQATEHGFSRAREAVFSLDGADTDFRFAVVYHLLSVEHNVRVRLKVDLIAQMPLIDSVTTVWTSADWYEREAFDLYGILFKGHPDLRRILTDYGFVGHPFRKDFPLIGNVEMRYDPDQKRVIYEPVSIESRTLVPRVIRDDNRYRHSTKDNGNNG